MRPARRARPPPPAPPPARRPPPRSRPGPGGRRSPPRRAGAGPRPRRAAGRSRALRPQGRRNDARGRLAGSALGQRHQPRSVQRQRKCLAHPRVIERRASGVEAEVLHVQRRRLMQGRPEIGVVGDPAGVEALTPDQVDLVVRVGAHAVAVDLGQPLHAGDGWRAGHVFRVGDQHQRLVVQAVGDVWAGADEAVDRLPAAGWRRRSAEPRRRSAWPRSPGSSSPDGAGVTTRVVVVRRLDGDLVLGAAGQPFIGAGDDAQHVRCVLPVAGSRMRSHERRTSSAPSGDAVREVQAVAQAEGVGPAVVAHRPRIGQRWIGLAVLVQSGQAGIQLQQELHVGRVADEGGIQRLRLATQVAEDVVGCLGGAGRQRRIERDDQGESEHGDPDRQAGPRARRGQAGHAAASIRARAADP